MTVGLVSSPRCAEHDTGPGHPEAPGRLRALMQRLQSDGLSAQLEPLEATLADPEALTRVHPTEYLARVERTIAAGARTVDSSDVNVGQASFDAARAAAGGALDATARVIDGRWSRAFVAVRPPGHHAELSLAMGFCLFNNAVIAARAAQAAGLERVAIVDWDVHHGNGSQHLTEHDPSLLYVSLHQYPHYPGTGAADERGVGAGEGTVLNCPLPPGSGDVEWLDAFEGQALPAVEAFAPQLVILSAGFDGHLLDPLSDTRLSAGVYGRMTMGLAEVAERCCAGRVVSLLEGGYSLEGLAESAAAHVGALL
jgi:acetoin utilization deacetylase AcuC-like enzyme